MHYIQSLNALEILDSRGNPTIQVNISLENGTTDSASVPSGISTGKNEAVELRDNDILRYKGKGVLKAIENINHILAPKLIGENPCCQAEIDSMMIKLDGTLNKSNLGANAILGVSLAIARVAAKAQDLPLYRYLAKDNKATQLPMPMVNILNGGLHADNSVDFQEYMIVPVGAPSFSEALRYAVETFYSLKEILRKKGYTTNVGDEGGFAPQLKSNNEACDLIVEAICAANYRPGADISIAIDPAATSFYEKKQYNLLKGRQGHKNSSQMIELYHEWIRNYPIVSIEDGLDENDWEGFREQTAVLGNAVQIVGDDILVTNPQIIKRAIKEKTCNAALIKLNQIGTLTETIEAITLCKNAGWNFVISHRSGETNDSFISDFSVAMGGGQIKTGSVCRGERIIKYNRLLEIESELGRKATFHNPFV